MHSAHPVPQCATRRAPRRPAPLTHDQRRHGVAPPRWVGAWLGEGALHDVALASLWATTLRATARRLSPGRGRRRERSADVQVKIDKTPFRDVLVVRSEVFEDARGFFTEVYRQDQFAELGVPSTFVQFNHSGSVRNVTRGLHFQWEPPMGKLMRVTRGEAFLVAVDLRKGSPTLGKAFTVVANDHNRLQVFAPAGFARGFCVLSEFAELQYLCTGTYSNKAESGIRWNDPALGIDWPVKEPILSDKDQKAQTLAEWLKRPESDHFKY
ncbi:MAG: dTDP-4-dehydrorhamnose 3,5-epimerase [Deltaproteobacteria bacterium]|nr:dTDP-4-dehydrorhamnose 3,5-epimerase [Deltaproteobacteria bacterium]